MQRKNDVLEDLSRRLFRVDEDAHVGRAGVHAFADSAAAAEHIDCVVGRGVEAVQQRPAVAGVGGDGDNVDLGVTAC